MRHLREIVRRTRATVARLAARTESRIDRLERDHELLSRRMAALDRDCKGPRTLQSLEEGELAKADAARARRNAMSDSDLKADLERQYGSTEWAEKLIKRVLRERKSGRGTNMPIAG